MRVQVPTGGHLWACFDQECNLHFEGQDLGPATDFVSGDGEYEWRRTIRAEHLPKLSVLLGAAPGDDLLHILEHQWSGTRSHELEQLLRECDIPMEFHSHGG